MLRLCIFLCAVSAVLAQVPVGQLNALVDLYDATSGDSWVDNTNWKADGTDPCLDQWFGVQCDDNNTMVIGLSLASNSLAGTFPATISDLDTLVTANFQNNFLAGELPNFATIITLQEVYIGNNFLDGTLPESWSALGTLTDLDLGTNTVSGTIPESWGDLTQLALLYLNNNQLIGTLPTFLQTQPPIESIRLQDNLFDCPLPAWCSDDICAPCYDYTENATATATPTPSISFVAPSSSDTPTPTVYPSASVTPSVTASTTVNTLNSWVTYVFLAILGGVVVVAIVGGILVCILRYIEVQKAKREHDEEEHEHNERLVQDY